MYVFGAFPPIISILMFAPVIIALRIDKKNIDHPIASNINQLAIGFFIGCLIYLGIGGYLQAYGNRDIWGYFGSDPIQNYGIILPVLLGGGFLYRKVRGQIRLFKFERGGIGASVLFLLTVIPFLLWTVITFLLELRDFLIAFAFPVLFGLWLLLKMSNYTWRYYVAFILLYLLVWFLTYFIYIGFSVI